MAKTIADIVAQLAEAKSPSELAQAHRALSLLIKRTRRKEDKELGPLAETYSAAMRIWEAEVADGVPLETRQQHLQTALKAAWPQTREWHYLCDRCSDTGWEPGICTPATPCGRRFRLPGQRDDDHTGQGHCAEGHSFVRPCVCPKGEARARQLQPKPVDPEDFQDAGKRKGFKKLMGR